jgi:hypothetical protein
MTLRPVNNSSAGVVQRTRTGRHSQHPPLSRVCALAQTGQSRLSEGHRPCRAGARSGKADIGFRQHRTFHECIFVRAVAVIIQTRTSRCGYYEPLKTAAMKRSTELLGTEVAPIVRAAQSKQ